MNDISYFICPMSKNIVDAVLQLNRTDIGFLPSRRQVDYHGGYVGWTTEQFSNYVAGRVRIERDHGGAGQGAVSDDGRDSYKADASCFNLIHVDPWKICTSKEQGLEKTLEDVLFINSINPNCHFEVGTEQAIFPLSSDDLFWFVDQLKKTLPNDIFQKIEYVVIQSGVGLDVVREINTGQFNLKKLQGDIEVCRYFGKKSKEHNGDFLTQQQRSVRFQHGLSSINIGPELSVFENGVYLQHFTPEQLLLADEICYASGLWKKWVTPEHDLSAAGSYFKICGHYNYNRLVLPDIDIVDVLKEKILTMVH